MTQWVADWAHDLASSSDGKVPLCPFAKKAWDSGEVEVIESQDLWETIHAAVVGFGAHKIVLCVQPEPEQDYFELEAGCNALNHWLTLSGHDIWLLASELHGKSIVFVQRASDLESASHALEKLGYYADYTEEDFARLIERRRKVIRS